jgi:hypothetical protein
MALLERPVEQVAKQATDDRTLDWVGGWIVGDGIVRVLEEQPHTTSSCVH